MSDYNTCKRTRRFGWKKTIATALKKGDFFSKIVCFLLIKLGFSNREIQELEVRNRNYLKIKKKYHSYLKNIEIEKSFFNGQKNNNVWVCWLQGCDEAPMLVKRCIQSIYKYLNDSNITVITAENYMEYVSLPGYILGKWKKGIISNTHFSDILRTELLVNYGGLWLDATTLLTGKIPDFVFMKPIFMFHYKERKDFACRCNNWFIYAEKNNRLLKCVRELLYCYWERECKLKDYFLWQIFMTMALDKYIEDYNEIYNISDENSHLLSYCIAKKFNQDYWKIVTSLTSIHKLSYKIDLSKKETGSYFDFLLEEPL